MATGFGAAPIDSEESLVARAAWFHFAVGLTQGEVASRLNVPNVKAHRLIARASREELIRVVINGGTAECLAREKKLARRCGLSVREVAPEADPRALGVLDARSLRLSVDGGRRP